MVPVIHIYIFCLCNLFFYLICADTVQVDRLFKFLLVNVGYDAFHSSPELLLPMPYILVIYCITFCILSSDIILTV